MMRVSGRDAAKAQSVDDELGGAPVRGQPVGGGPHTPHVVIDHIRGLNEDGTYDVTIALEQEIRRARKASEPTAEQAELLSWQIVVEVADVGSDSD